METARFAERNRRGRPMYTSDEKRKSNAETRATQTDCKQTDGERQRERERERERAREREKCLNKCQPYRAKCLAEMTVVLSDPPKSKYSRVVIVCHQIAPLVSSASSSSSGSSS